MYKFKSSKRYLFIACAIGLIIGLIIGFYLIQPKPRIETQQKLESMGYFSPDGKYHNF